MPKSNTNQNKQPTVDSANLSPKLPSTLEALQRKWLEGVGTELVAHEFSTV